MGKAMANGAPMNTTVLRGNTSGMVDRSKNLASRKWNPNPMTPRQN